MSRPVNSANTEKSIPQTYKYWELFRWAKDKDVFEIVESTTNSYVGERYVFKKTGNGNTIMKKVGTHGSDTTEGVVVPLGAITGATYVRVDQYKSMKMQDAMGVIFGGGTVYVKHPRNADYHPVNVCTEFKDISVYDLGNFIDLRFYSKNYLS